MRRYCEHGQAGVGMPRGENEWRGLNSQFNSYSQSKTPTSMMGFLIAHSELSILRRRSRSGIPGTATIIFPPLLTKLPLFLPILFSLRVELVPLCFELLPNLRCFVLRSLSNRINLRFVFLADSFYFRFHLLTQSSDLLLRILVQSAKSCAQCAGGWTCYRTSWRCR